jgi:hypothetical protein
MFKVITKLALAAMLVVIGLSAFAGTASASRSLSLNPGGAILANGLGRLSFNTTLVGTPVAIRCDVTLHGSMSRVAPKIAGTLIGNITSVLVPLCDTTFGQTTTATTLFPAPWKIRYQGISGSLPNPSSVQALLENAQFQISVNTIGTCLYQGNVPININLRGSAPNTSGLITIRSHNVPLRRATGSCGANGELRGTFGVTPTQTVILLN